jgi:hypothetical protein
VYAPKMKELLEYLYDGADGMRMQGDELRIRIFTASE